jgi:hypothetical protein
MYLSIKPTKDSLKSKLLKKGQVPYALQGLQHWILFYFYFLIVLRDFTNAGYIHNIIFFHDAPVNH